MQYGLADANILAMANTAPLRYKRVMTLRGDREFFAAVAELLQMDESADAPANKSEVIRQAVLEMRDRRRQAGGASNGKERRKRS